VSDAETTVSHFAAYLSKVCTNSTDYRRQRLKYAYKHARFYYCGQTIIMISIERVTGRNAEKQLVLTAEHVLFSHPLLLVILSKHCNCMIHIGHVPECFGQSYTVSLPNASCNIRSKSVNDFRGISICPLISKVLEHCILDRYGIFF